MELANLLLTALIAILMVCYLFWLKPRLDSIDKIVNIYKGFGNDYEKWIKQHHDESLRLEKELEEIKALFGADKTDQAIEAAKKFVKRIFASFELDDKLIKLQDDHINQLKSQISDLENLVPPQEQGLREWIRQMIMRRKSQDNSLAERFSKSSNINKDKTQ